MSLIDRIKETASVRRSATVAEWGEDDSPLVVWASALSVGDMSFVQRRHKNFLDEMKVDGMLDLIIRKAEDKDGEKLFTLDDKMTLKRARMSTIATLFGDLWGDLGDDHEKN